MKMTDLNIECVWEEYIKCKDSALKEKLILHYAPLVKSVASRVSMHVGQHVEFDDLISYGIFGLLDAIEKFDIQKGVKFETYASLRIRGEIIDNIRKMDWIPRTLRQKNKELEKAYQDMEHKLGRQPTEAEMAEFLQVSVEEYHELIRKSSISTLTSLDYYIEQNYDLGDTNVANYKDSPEWNYDTKEIKTILIEAIDKLTEKEKKVVTLYYFEEFNLKEISKIMGVTESRISQIHSKAVFKLKNKLGKYKYLLFS